MKYYLHNSEKGQAIVYLVLGFVVFLGFVALAIDGGMALANRRHQQNASDAASLAGGAAAALHLQKNQMNSCDDDWSCVDEIVTSAENNAYPKAKNRAGDNNFTIDYDITDKNGVNVTCGGDSWKTGYIDVTVDISATTQSNFMQLLYPKALQNVTEAVTQVDPGGPLEFGNAVVALNSAHCADPGSEGIIMGGSGNVYITGGNIFSNGCLRDNGGVSVTITDGIPLGNDLSHITEDNWSPTPVYTDSQEIADAYSVPTPNVSGGLCTDPAAHNVSTRLPAGPLSGLYCVTSSQGLTINNNDSVEGTNVTIFIIQGGLTVNGTPHIELSAPPQTPDPSPAIPGVLIYLPPTNSSSIKINGDETSELNGLILAPKSSIELNGNGKTMYDGQVIGWNVDITGNADFHMQYHGCNGYIMPPTITLYK
jgi:hypothetical protein